MTSITHAARVMLRPIVLPLLIFVIALSVAHAQTDGIAINEVMSSNRTTIADEDGDFEDWIELYNFGSVIVNLEGYGLSDDYDRPFRWSFPDTLIQPGEFLLVWASGKDRTVSGEPLHTNYSISSAGEEVILTDPSGQRVDELPPTDIPTNISYGRYPDAAEEWFYFDTPTPGAPNILSEYQDLLDEVHFSHSGGFYSDAFELALSHPDTTVTILYTLDGSIPSEESIGGTTYLFKNQYPRNPGDPFGEFLTGAYHTHEYEQPIPIFDRSSEPNRISYISSTTHVDPFYLPDEPVFKGTVVRARAIKAGAVPGVVTTHSFFVTPDRNIRFTLPVISLSTQEDRLFDYNTGVYVAGVDFDEWRANNPLDTIGGHRPANYHRRGFDWELPAHIEFFEVDDASPVISQNIGFRIHGSYSRSNAMKSLRLYARNSYGESHLNHRMFPELPHDSYKRLLLRNSGNDWFATMFRDALAQSVVSHLSFDTQAYRPAVLFINGEYWGIHNMRERYDKHYLARVYGVDPENVDYLERWGSALEGDEVHYSNTLIYITDNGLQADEHYEYIQTRIDVDNFADYQISQIFARNTDWPANNNHFWRLRTHDFDPDAPHGHDGRWRWLMFDLDFGFGLAGGSQSYTHNTLAFATETDGPTWPNPPWSTFLLRKFLENESFRVHFINRFADLLNSALSTDRVMSVMNEFKSRIEPEMPYQIARWKNFSSMARWAQWLEPMVTFIEERPAHQRQHIREFFDIEREVALAVDVSDDLHGSIRVNTIDIGPETPGIGETPYPWTGIYFSGIPVSVHAAPAEGYVFSHWEGVDTLAHEPSVTLTLEDDAALTAVFIRESPPLEYPEPFDLTSGPYEFREWAETEPAGTFPESMAFVYMVDDDPGLGAAIDGFTSGAYDLETRTRINGLGPGGIAFINTSNEEGNPGYPGRKLGGALLVLDTSASDTVYVSWTGGTVTPNSRVYHLRLQYRSGDSGPFANVLDGEGLPVEYVRSNAAGHFRTFPPVRLSAEATGGDELQLLWRYYHTGERLDDDSGARDQLRLGDVIVSADAVAHLPAPQLVAPANDTSKAAPPTFRWEPALHATAYNLQIARDDAFGSMVLDTSGIEGTSYTYVGELEEGATYFWRVRAGHEGVKGAWSKTRMLTILSTVGVGETAPVAFELLQSYPNPFSLRAHIRYGIPQHAHVRVKVFNSLGQRVRILVDERQTPGWHEVKLDAADLPSGVYLYRLTAGDFTDTGALTLVR